MILLEIPWLVRVPTLTMAASERADTLRSTIVYTLNLCDY